MIQRIRRKTRISEATITRVLEALAEVVAEDIADGKVACLQGVGRIDTVERGGYKRNDPGHAGCTIDVPLHRKIKFTPSIDLLRRLTSLDPTKEYRR